MPSKSDIENEARELLQKHGVTEPAVDIFAIIKAEGLRLTFDEMDDQHSGFLLVENNKATIAINRDHHPNRQRFTAAHELGHYVLHSQGRDRLFVDSATQTFLRNQVSSQGTKQEEIEANQFAASLLMPRKMLKDALNEFEDDITDLDIYRMSAKFEVSEQAMTLRLTRVTSLKSALS